MKRIRAEGHEWFRSEREVVDYVRNRIRSAGPLRAQDFEGARGASGWWDWKPAKRALEFLFQSGDLAVVGRRGFQKVFDLPERVLPTDLDLRFPSASEMAERYIDQATTSLGIFAAEETAYMRKDGREGLQAELMKRIEEGRLVEVRLEAAKGSGSASRELKYFADPNTISRITRRRNLGEPKAIVLSPFDPLIIDRKRTLRLFKREYQLECYLPASKRKFGYFALPLLYLEPGRDATIVGLLDAKVERGRKAFIARRLSLDPPNSSALSRAHFAQVLASALWNYAAFNRAETIRLERFESSDGRLERSARAAIARSE
jgi:hypothetical protein